VNCSLEALAFWHKLNELMGPLDIEVVPSE